MKTFSLFNLFLLFFLIHLYTCSFVQLSRQPIKKDQLTFFLFAAALFWWAGAHCSFRWQEVFGWQEWNSSADVAHPPQASTWSASWDAFLLTTLIKCGYLCHCSLHEPWTSLTIFLCAALATKPSNSLAMYSVSRCSPMFSLLLQFASQETEGCKTYKLHL